jgi:hypothetical protein
MLFFYCVELKPLARLENSRTTYCRLFATAYPICSQLHEALGIAVQWLFQGHYYLNNYKLINKYFTLWTLFGLMETKFSSYVSWWQLNSQIAVADIRLCSNM